ncbi:FAD-linked oxidase C-terminal domain-containing protein [Marinilabiliaceae bacterium ANBcel2]|nr:FAD-linked oxidase C-terminal domain-containing protein [Marinilabiliaceae bacterium ANBcel2]
MDDESKIPFNDLNELLKGDVKVDLITRSLYSTDASVYKEVPLAVAYPRDKTDVRHIIEFALNFNLSITPRGAGTSLAGQAIGKGIVVDLSRYMDALLEINSEERWVRVEPGIVLDKLNSELSYYNLFFAPETSTSNRCTIGGMVANNSAGLRSLRYGTTRDYVIEIEAFLANGEEILIKPLQKWEFDKKCRKSGQEGEIYRLIKELYCNSEIREEIKKEFPHMDISRRNSGYALDQLIETSPFLKDGDLFNLSKIIAGSEGTLLFITSVKLSLLPLPAFENKLLVIHFNSLNEALEANSIVVKNFDPDSVELMDRSILTLAQKNPLQRENRFFIEGDPAALLIVQKSGGSFDCVDSEIALIIEKLKSVGLGYFFPVVAGNDINRVWELRRAGLGVLSNMRGDARPVSLIEDSAVRVEDLPDYIRDIDEMLKGYGKRCVYHAHAGVGELHIRPVIDLTCSEEIVLFRKIGESAAKIVKGYSGSLSGEHGDGRLRGEFLPIVVGDLCYQLMKRVKEAFDPYSLFNPGKVVDASPMDKEFRYKLKSHQNLIDGTRFNWSKELSFAGAVNRCSGSGDCVRDVKDGLVMCPSYSGTRDERDSVRGRANVLRAFFEGGDDYSRLSMDEVVEVLDLCLSCKACRRECPSGVDMARLKSEFMHYFYSKKAPSFETRLMANTTKVNSLFSRSGRVGNYFLEKGWFKLLLQQFAGVSSSRTLPLYSRINFDKWFKTNRVKCFNRQNGFLGKVLFFGDEFINYYDSHIGIKSVLLLQKLGYEVALAPVRDSGRALITSGFLSKAALIASRNVERLADLVGEGVSLVGCEPAAVLTLRDEYPDLVKRELYSSALNVASATYTIEEFLYREIELGQIKKESFTREAKEIYLHIHCHQKSLCDSSIVTKLLSFPENYRAVEIKAGCCGMGGGFGYKARNYNLSMQIGENDLFPKIRSIREGNVMVATGHSCRHQIADGTGVKALHPAELLFDALI